MAAPHGHHAPHSAQPQDHYSHASYPGAFGLRAASWEHRSPPAPPNEEVARSHAPNSHPHYPYTYPPPAPNPPAGQVSPESSRPYVHEETPNGTSGHAWPSSPHPAENVQAGYGVQPMRSPTNYSDRPNEGRGPDRSSQPPPVPAAPVQAWTTSPGAYQATSRASTRIAARESTQQTQAPSPGGVPPGMVQAMHGMPAMFMGMGMVMMTPQGPMTVQYPPQVVPAMSHMQMPMMYQSAMVSPSQAQQQQQQQQQQVQPSQTGQKRTGQSNSDDEGDKKKAKKSRAKKASKPESSSSASETARRGSVAKARQSTQDGSRNDIAPPVPYIGKDDHNKEGDAPTLNATSLHPELQFARCMSNRYKPDNFPRCVACTRRWAGDTCRFQGIRFFLKDDQGIIRGFSFVENHKPDAPALSFPNTWNIPLKKASVQRVKRTVAEALLPILHKERKHLETTGMILRHRESDVRATCDTCMTSIFSSSWMCRTCGREACEECFKQVKELTEDQAGATHAEVAALQSRREKHAHANPFFLACNRRNEHKVADFTPMSRFERAELQNAIKEMQETLSKPDEDALPETSEELLSGWVPAQPPAPPVKEESSSLAGAITPPEERGNPVIDIPSHSTRSFAYEALTEDIFRRVWAKADPLVVTGLGARFKEQWTPQYFIEKYGAQVCTIVDCQSDASKKNTVGEFFGWFGKHEGRDKLWKLKDWPTTADFASACPELHHDFSQAVPMQDYVRRDGVLNLASHFPSNAIGPDLGPKMYNALASSERDGTKGSTRLHMDMADAVNIMAYASTTAAGAEGYAAWDIFKAEDAEIIRKFLRERFTTPQQQDPIHSQQYYLDPALRKQLYEKTGVKSHRIYQRPGEAVFIPAGCAHQVINLADCIKVAIDFVSPENVQRCERLTREFREQNQSMMWKEDVLQLRTMMWFAWLSCCRQEKML